MEVELVANPVKADAELKEGDAQLGTRLLAELTGRVRRAEERAPESEQHVLLAPYVHGESAPTFKKQSSNHDSDML